MLKKSKSVDIKKVILKKFNPEDLKESLLDIKLYNDIRTLVDRSNYQFYLFGINIAVPIIRYFMKYKDGEDLHTLKKISKKINIKNILFTNVNEESITGINALNIQYNGITNDFIWDCSFEEFIGTKELKITSWIQPVDQLISCILIADLFECFFDLEHHFKALATILSMDDDILRKLSIERPRYKKNQHLFLKSKLPKKLRASLQSALPDIPVSGDHYQCKTGVYPYPYMKAFAKMLPKELKNYFPAALNLYSPQNKEDFIKKFKKATPTTKLLMIIFNKKDIPEIFKLNFAEIYRNYEDKELLIKKELAINYDAFEKAMQNYAKIKVGITSNARLKNLFSKGLMQELSTFTKKAPGKLISSALGYIPKANVLLDNPVDYKHYEIKQIHSVQELISTGDTFGNCLRNYPNYQKSLKKRGELFLVFTAKKRVKNLCSFVTHIKISNKNFNCLEIKRKQNNNTSQQELMVLQEFLISLDLIQIPDEFYAHFMMAIFSKISDMSFNDAINQVTSDAILIVPLLKKLAKSNRWLYKVDSQLISDEVRNFVSNKIQDELGFKYIEFNEDVNAA